QLLSLFKSRMYEMEREKLSKKVWTDQCGEVQTSLEIEILESTDLEKRNWLKFATAEEYPPGFPLSLMDFRNRSGSLIEEENKKLTEAMKKLKAENPTFYQRLKMNAAFGKLISEFPSPEVIREKGKVVKMIGREGNLKSFFAFATARVNVCGKM